MSAARGCSTGVKSDARDLQMRAVVTARALSDQGMCFSLTEDQQMIQRLAASFVDDFLMPLEPALLEREADGGKLRLTDEEKAPLMQKCKELGLWGLDVPEEVSSVQCPHRGLAALSILTICRCVCNAVRRR